MTREMRNSGVQWIGEIPKEWKVVQLKRNSRVVSGKEIPVELDATDSNAIPVYGSGGIFKYTDRAQYNGEVVMFGRKGTIGKPQYVNDKFWAVDTMYFLVHDVKKLYPKYNYYQLSAFNWDFYITQTALPSIVAIEILNGKFPLPPLSEQKAIADFLDAKCGEIDGLLSDLDAEVKTLAEYKKSLIAETVTRGLNPNVPMKSSGIPWADTIPAHWNVHPVYSYFSERIHKNFFGSEQNLLSLSYGKIIRKDINAFGGLLPASYNTYNIVESGDIVIRPTDLQNDKRSLRTGLVTEHGIITSAYIALKPNDNIYSPYYHYLLHSYDVKKVFYNMGNGVRQGLNYGEFSRLKLIEPPLSEQQAIADFLDTKCAAIDQAIMDKTTQIETLKVYKSSLIYEYVTGKKQVAL